MPSEWPQVTVAQIAAPSASALATGPFGSSISSKYFVESGVPVIRGANLSADVSCRLSDDGLVFVSNEKACEFQRSVARRGDLVFTCWGTINQVGLIDDAAKFDEYIVSNKQMKLTVDPNKADARFVYYVFSGPQKQQEILENGIGSSVPGFNLGQLRAHVLLLPPLSEQRAIAGYLKLLDDRIDLLHQTNATLESIAQALFKSWFIDFGPVRAKAEGREPEGMDAATAALFPAEFEESELGLIPKGWSVGTFGTLAVLGKGSVNPLDFPTRLFEHYSLPAFDAGQLPVLEEGAAIKSNKTRIPKGAVLQSKLNPHIPRVWLVEDEGELAVCSTEFLPWVARKGASPALIYCTLRSPTFETQVRTLVTGTSNSHQRVKPDQVASLSVVVAPSAVTEAFDSVASSLLNKVAANRLKARSLAEVRDAFLPRLISGKLRLPEAQEQAEDAHA